MDISTAVPRMYKVPVLSLVKAMDTVLKWQGVSHHHFWCYRFSNRNNLDLRHMRYQQEKACRASQSAAMQNNRLSIEKKKL